jgi:hypothetical protein
MSTAKITFLRNLVAARPLKLHSKIAHTLSYSEDLGRVVGAAVQYSDADYAKAETKLRNAGYALQAPSANATRASTQDASSEKHGTAPVTLDLVAVVPLGLATVQAPPGAFLAMKWQQAIALPYEVLLICENLEPMLRLHLYPWIAPHLKGRPALALFRGAPDWFRIDAANRFITADKRPVLAMFDFDPQGLAMAAALPRREALCLPEWEELKPIVMARRRADLIADQVDGCRKGLDACEQQDIAQAWRRMGALGYGLQQEAYPESRESAADLPAS